MIKRTMYILSILFLMTGCATTGDPRQGGLFGWSEEMAQDRLAERQNTVQYLEQEQYAQQSRSEYLEMTAAEKQSQKAALTRQIAQLDREIAAKRRQISRASSRPRTQSSSYTQTDVAGLEQQVSALTQERDRLIKESEAFLGIE